MKKNNNTLIIVIILLVLAVFILPKLGLFDIIGISTLRADEDTYIDSSHPTENMGDKTYILLENDIPNNDIMIGFAKFTETWDPNYEILEVEFRVRTSGSFPSDYELKIHGGLIDWDENTLTWDSFTSQYEDISAFPIVGTATRLDGSSTLISNDESLTYFVNNNFADGFTLMLASQVPTQENIKTREVGGDAGIQIARINACYHYWSCTEWGACMNGKQTRICTDRNTDCPGNNGKPSELQSCQEECNTDADLDCDGVVSFDELNSYASSWVAGSVTFTELMEAANAWVVG